MAKKKNISILLCMIMLWMILSFVAGKGTAVASYDKEPVRILIDAGQAGKHQRK